MKKPKLKPVGWGVWESKTKRLWDGYEYRCKAAEGVAEAAKNIPDYRFVVVRLYAKVPKGVRK